MSLRLPPVSDTASGMPCASVIRWCFEPGRARSTGLGPVLGHPSVPGVLYVVVGAAPAAASVAGFVRLAQDAGWLVRVIATPMGERFIDVAQLAALTGDRVRIGFRMPDEPDELPPADAVVVAPANVQHHE